MEATQWNVVVVVVVEVDDEVVAVVVIVVGADLLASSSLPSSSSSTLYDGDKLISFALKEGALAGGNDASIAMPHWVRHLLGFALVLIFCVDVDLLVVVGGAGGGLTGRELSGNLGVVFVWFDATRVEGCVLCVTIVVDEVESIGKSRYSSLNVQLDNGTRFVGSRLMHFDLDFNK